MSPLNIWVSCVQERMLRVSPGMVGCQQLRGIGLHGKILTLRRPGTLTPVLVHWVNEILNYVSEAIDRPGRRCGSSDR